MVRRGDAGAGTFIFVNNYARLQELPPKTRVRLQLDVHGVAAPISIPSPKSEPLTIGSGVWAVWPADLALLPETGVAEAGAPPSLAYATAQLVTRVRESPTSEVLVFVETEGVAVELVRRPTEKALLPPPASRAPSFSPATQCLLERASGARGSLEHGAFASPCCACGARGAFTQRERVVRACLSRGRRPSRVAAA